MPHSSKVPVIAQNHVIGIEQAHLTLLNAARFFGSPGGAPMEGRYRAKVIGNGLRELDRFLSVLLDELAMAAGWNAADLRALARLRNTSIKLDTVCTRLGIDAVGWESLRALGRCRDALFHCGGTVRRGDTRHAQALTLIWPTGTGGGAGAMIRIGELLSVGPAQLFWVGALYIRIGNDLMAAVAPFRGIDATRSRHGVPVPA